MPPSARAWRDTTFSACLPVSYIFAAWRRNPHQPGIVLVEAAVHEERYYHDELARTDRDRAAAADDVEVRTAPDAERLGLRVVLSAVLDDGRRVTEESCLGLAGLRRCACLK